MPCEQHASSQPRASQRGRQSARIQGIGEPNEVRYRERLAARTGCDAGALDLSPLIVIVLAPLVLMLPVAWLEQTVVQLFR
jgi:hypothetical protein